MSNLVGEQVKAPVEQLPGVGNADVNVVWNPPWTPERLSPDELRHQPGVVDLGLLVLEVRPGPAHPQRVALEHDALADDPAGVVLNQAVQRQRVDPVQAEVGSTRPAGYLRSRSVRIANLT